MKSPKTQGVEGNKEESGSKKSLRQKSMFSSPQQSLPPVSSDVGFVQNMLPTSRTPIQRVNLKSARSSLKGTLHVASKPKLSIGNQLPQKRLSPEPINDDDFQ